MNRRDMKKQVKKTVAEWLLLNLNNDRAGFIPGPSLIDEIKLDVFRGGYTGTDAEIRRLESILYELHREANDYEV